ncbi:uncharacterized protein LODBEIA_P58880 [Lodderomyces beijingensis]|uniref:DNA-directed RNA polymerase n=1 Tax=Lodderomyces beijingensis TaxID=1775926 RepID=A0ABP0ZU44_9ASCO
MKHARIRNVRFQRFFILRRHYAGFASSVAPRQPIDDFSTAGIFDFSSGNLLSKDFTATRRWSDLVRNYSRAMQDDKNDLAFSVLESMAELAKEPSRTQEPQAQQYVKCFEIWLKSFMSPNSSARINELRAAVDNYDSVVEARGVLNGSGIRMGTRGMGTRSQSGKSEMASEIAKAALHSYYLTRKHRPSSIHTFPVKEFFTQVVNKYEVDISSLRKELAHEQHEYLSALEELVQLPEDSGADLALPDAELTNDIPIEPYTEKCGDLQFERACSYIVDHKFRWKGQRIAGPIFEYYDTLESGEKEAFMREYLEFNAVKQANLEKYSHRLIKSSLDSGETSTKMKFSPKLQQLLDEWVESTTRSLEKKLAFTKPVSEEEAILHRSKPFLGLFPLKDMVSHLIHALVGKLDERNLPLNSFLQHWRFSYVRQVSISMKSLDYKQQLFQLMSEKSIDEFSHSLIAAVLNSSYFQLTKFEINMIAEESNPADLEPFLDPDVNVNNDDDNDNHNQNANDNYGGGLCYAFRNLVKQEGVKSKRYLVAHPAILKLLKTASYYGELSYLPSLCTPKPWRGPSSGGYLHSHVDFVTGFDRLQRQLLHKAHSQGKLDRAFTCLDQMGQTAWVINQDMLRVFNRLMELPNGFLEIPPRLDQLPQGAKFSQEALDARNLRKLYEARRQIANAYGANGDVLYHCYMFDFRGRAYALSSMNHYGGDLTRSLFQFWETKPLGDEGFYWLKYQLASLFKPGQESKCEEFCEKYRLEIVESAADPLKCDWWLKADKPFQVLSVCFEIAKVWQHESKGGSVGDYRCRLPIHQDGSCNGLQHYAALAGDELGGKSVNLLPSDVKQDIYTEVRDVVERKIREDIVANAKAKDSDLNSDSDSDLNGINVDLLLRILDRKLVKRPVMTTVYGVTSYGAIDQIKARIKEMITDHEQNPSRADKYSDHEIAALKSLNTQTIAYLVSRIFSAINELFVNAMKIEHWLVNTANRINTSYNVKTIDYLSSLKSTSLKKKYFTTAPVNYSPISWISPAGFPVVQIYRNLAQSSTRGALGVSTRVDTDQIAPMDRRKNELAIAPNFIHSLDASHMSMTCDVAASSGLVFASIHDSYWTHACDVKQLSALLRERFVAMYSFDYMACIKRDFENQMKNSYQLLFFYEEDNKELWQEIKELRKTYRERKLVDQLETELRQLDAVGYGNHKVSKLLGKFKPVLYHKVGTKIYEYFAKDAANRVKDGKKSKKVPVFVPARVMDLPVRGNLDITQVAQSRYFFS